MIQFAVFVPEPALPATIAVPPLVADNSNCEDESPVGSTK